MHNSPDQHVRLNTFFFHSFFFPSDSVVLFRFGHGITRALLIWRLLGYFSFALFFFFSFSPRFSFTFSLFYIARWSSWVLYNEMEPTGTVS